MLEWDEGDRFSFEDSDRFEEDSLCSWMSEPESVCNNWRGWKKSSSSGQGANGSASRIESLMEMTAKQVAINFPFEVVENVYPPVPEEVQMRIAFWSFPESEEDIRLYSCLANGSPDEFQRGETLLRAKAVKDLLQIGFHLSATVQSFQGQNPPPSCSTNTTSHPVPDHPPAIGALHYVMHPSGLVDVSSRNNQPARGAVGGGNAVAAAGSLMSSNLNHRGGDGTSSKDKESTNNNNNQGNNKYSVAITFDRRRITSCECTCNSVSSWCSHVVAVCLFRITQPLHVTLRAPLTESLSRLERNQLRKFSQYLIAELPKQFLPTAQKLLDQLLSSSANSINASCGGPDPTGGAGLHEQTSWCLDESQLHDNIHKILSKLCVPSPIVFSDVNYLSSTAPPAAAEWTSLLRPLRGREPEGMWNLLSIVRELFRRGDQNAVPLLTIVTKEILSCDQITLWWFNTRVSLNSSPSNNRAGVHSTTHTSQHACSSLCDEIVVLWRLCGLNPRLDNLDRCSFFLQLKLWHRETVEKMIRMRSTGSNKGPNFPLRKGDLESFPGFKPALEACLLTWDDYPILGVTDRTWVEIGKLVGFPYPPSMNIAQLTASCSVSAPLNPISSNTRFKLKDSKNKVSLIRISAPVDPNQPSTSSSSTSSSSQPTSDQGQVKGPSVIPEGKEADSASVHPSGPLSSLPLVIANEAPIAPSTSSPPNSPSNLTNGDLSEPSINVEPELPSPSPSPRKPDSARSSISSASEGFCEDSDTLNNLPSMMDMVHISSSSIKENVSASGISNKEVSSNNDESDAGPVPQPLASVPSVPPTLKDEPVAGPSRPHHPTPANAGGHVPTAKNPHQPGGSKGKKELPDPTELVIKRIEDPMEMLFARAEALHAHGFTKDACRLAVQLAEQMLANPPNLLANYVAHSGKPKKGRKFSPTFHNISLAASATLSKAAFLCSVLTENVQHQHLAFCIGLFGLEMARPPASTKALEVKLANQEQDLVLLLKRIPLTSKQLDVLRERTERLITGTHATRGDSLVPFTLASYIFDSLVLSVTSGSSSKSPPITGRLSSDETVGFEAAVAALALKANVAEAEHPLLCEGTRRQRGELAVTLLVHYKDDPPKLSKIMDHLLDKDVHHMYKSTGNESSKEGTSAGISTSVKPAVTLDVKPLVKEEVPTTSKDLSGKGKKPKELVSKSSPTLGTGASSSKEPALSSSNSDESLESPPSGIPAGTGLSCTYPRVGSSETPQRRPSIEGDKSEEWDVDYKQWEAKFRCTNLKTCKKPSIGMAAIDSSAPETTSSDNSPTIVRRYILSSRAPNGVVAASGGPGSDSGSSESGASPPIQVVSATDQKEGDKPVANEPLIEASCSNVKTPSVPVTVNSTPVTTGTNNGKSNRSKGKKAYPSVPNQPSEASAHFMFELAKTVLNKAGGNSSSAVLFTQQSSNNGHRGPHRPLHNCAFQIGVYALGLHNSVSPNWLSRTYSSHVSWITGQAMEIGCSAINFLYETWEGHLTPPEVCSLADKASRNRDSNMVRAAARLALSCLPHAQALNPNEITRALIQCKEHSTELLEQACLAVEGSAKTGGVYPEVLFEVARRWYELYEENGTIPIPTRGHRVRNLVNATVGEFQVPAPTAAEVQQRQQQQQAAAQALQYALQPQQGQIAAAANALALQRMYPNEANQFMQVALGSSSTFGILPNPYSQSPQQTPQSAYIYQNGMMVPQQPLVHPAFIQGTVQYNHYYPAVSAPSSQNPMMNQPMNGYRPAVMAPNAVQMFSGQPIMSNVIVSPNGMNQTNRLQMIPQIGQHNNSMGMGGHYSAQLQLHGVHVSLGPPQMFSQGPGSNQMMHPQMQPASQLMQGQQQNQHQPQLQQKPMDQKKYSYLLSAYRVGMLAMETLSRRLSDDRPQARYSRNPLYGEDVRWLLMVSKKLGITYLQDFCICTVNSVSSPFVLFDVVMEAAQYLSQSANPVTSQPFKSPILIPLIQKCQEAFRSCAFAKMYHIVTSDYDDFVSIIRAARVAYQLSPNGMQQFDTMLGNIRTSKSCRKELWNQVVSSLQRIPDQPMGSPNI